eukprot:gb/GECH01008634.1/.p1 GENE.gb/GECH01008634.1/~~gb/GECH01008634.1/.p1  ORF type:complete len:541 (+),score=120.21 gb/GECH01008634.1/:1-1623(+)
MSLHTDDTLQNLCTDKSSSILHCSSQAPHCPPENLLNDNAKAVWVAEETAPQEIVLHIEREAIFSCVGWCCLNNLITNPRRIVLYVAREDGETGYEEWADLKTEEEYSGDVLFEIADLPLSYTIFKFSIVETYGEGKEEPNMNRIYLLEHVPPDDGSTIIQSNNLPAHVEDDIQHFKQKFDISDTSDSESRSDDDRFDQANDPPKQIFDHQVHYRQKEEPETLKQPTLFGKEKSSNNLYIPQTNNSQYLFDEQAENPDLWSSELRQSADRFSGTGINKSFDKESANGGETSSPTPKSILNNKDKNQESVINEGKSKNQMSDSIDLQDSTNKLEQRLKQISSQVDQFRVENPKKEMITNRSSNLTATRDASVSANIELADNNTQNHLQNIQNQVDTCMRDLGSLQHSLKTVVHRVDRLEDQQRQTQESINKKNSEQPDYDIERLLKDWEHEFMHTRLKKKLKKVFHKMENRLTDRIQSQVQQETSEFKRCLRQDLGNELEHKIAEYIDRLDLSSSEDEDEEAERYPTLKHKKVNHKYNRKK